MDDYREQIEQLSYTLSSELESAKDGSFAIFIGKVEDIVVKMSKKGNQFAIVNLMDFHGNMEIMLFADKLEQLREMNQKEPIAFKGKITHTDFGPRIGITKIMTLKEAIKETKKTKKEVQEKPIEPINLSVRLSNESDVLDTLYTLIRQNPGRHNVVIDSAIRVDSKLLLALEGNEAVDIL